MTKQKEFTPDWTETKPPEKSYRSIFKWGNPEEFKHPDERLFRMMKEEFNMTDDDFINKKKEGNEEVTIKQKIKLPKADIDAITKIVGTENVSMDDYSRVKFSTGKTMEEAMYLREQKPGKVCDIAVHPKDKEDVKKIINYCNKKKIPVNTFGGGSSVNFGLKPMKGGITLVLSTHMNRLINLNEDNQTVTVEAGMMGPDYEKALNNAHELYNASRRYTGGHFPQSFEYSSVGGWVVTLGSGQQSSYYGDAYDLVISQEYVTPSGTFKTLDYPATATGPKVNDIMKGSEGTFGILVEVTMKIFRYMPENTKKFAFIFPSWEDGVNASKEICQSEFGMPSVFRLSDPEETNVAMKLYGIEGTFIDTMIKIRGYKPMERCILLGQSDGAGSFTKNVKKRIKKICKSHGAMYITGYPVKKWEQGRYKDPYLREDLHDYGVITDTLETGITWDKIHNLHQGVRKFIKSHPNMICMTHASHFYPQGTNLYFIFMAKLDDTDKYIELQDGIIESLHRYGGSLSHHHGVGRMLSPWLEDQIGKEQMDVLRALKNHFDPKNIMNPGGQLGLDLKNKNWRKIK